MVDAGGASFLVSLEAHLSKMQVIITDTCIGLKKKTLRFMVSLLSMLTSVQSDLACHDQKSLMISSKSAKNAADAVTLLG